MQNYNIVGTINCDFFKDNWIDLYTDLAKLKKTEYAPDERIIIYSSFDYYSQKTHGIILQSLQIIINQLDISNYFIIFKTTNPNIKEEYKHVLKNYSSDTVPFTTKIVKGCFDKHSAKSIKPFVKFFFDEKIHTLTNEQKELLYKNKLFCLAPWLSLTIGTDNNVRPCCEYKGSLGSSNLKSLKEIWNDKELKTLRYNMLNSKVVSGCSACYKMESLGKDSMRNTYNREFAKHINKVNNTLKDGTLEDFNLAYIDPRFNNLCNLSCKMCGPSSSSSWHKPAKDLGLFSKNYTSAFVSAGRHKKDIYEQIIQHINSLEKIYFAGGEPLLIDDFYSVLDVLDKAGKHDIKLAYNTNLTTLKSGKNDIFKAWKNFKNISVYASLDAENERATYLRSGTIWQNVINFRKKMIELRPDINFTIKPVVSIINSLHLPDFHKNWVEQGLINPEDFSLGMLYEPSYMRIDTAPEPLREMIIERYNQHIDWLTPLDKLGRATQDFKGVINQLQNKIDFDRENFWSKINVQDNYYNVKLLDVFPELECLNCN